ncbi:MAG: cupin domain-containing protein [Microcoleus sp. SIO2G3]|nr:cupin domain-containing protein [Microcoleus sp. SIO2G3]
MSNVSVKSAITVIGNSQLTAEHAEGLARTIAVSQQTTGQSEIYMCKVVIPPCQAETAIPHAHIGTETAIYIEKGEVVVFFGDALEEVVIASAGEYLHIPPGVIHYPVNRQDSEMAALVTRTPGLTTQLTRTYPDIALPSAAAIAAA